MTEKPPQQLACRHFAGGKIAGICTAIGLRAALVAAAMQTEERCFADKSGRGLVIFGSRGQENRPRLLFFLSFFFFPLDLHL